MKLPSSVRRICLLLSLFSALYLPPTRAQEQKPVFPVTQVVNIPSTSDISASTLLDFDGDGKADLAYMTHPSGSQPYWLNVQLGFGGPNPVTKSTPICDAHYAYRFAAGDVNNDGKPDIVLTCADKNGDQVLFGNGDGTFQSPVSYPGTGLSPILVDLNGDGYLDLVTSQTNAQSNSAQLAVLLNKGSLAPGSFAPPVWYALCKCNNTVSLGHGDVNGDGKQDIVASESATTMMIVYGNGDGTLQPPITDHVGGIVSAVADFNGDGFADDPVLGGIFPGSPNGFLSTGIRIPYVQPAYGSGGGQVSAAVLSEDGIPSVIFPEILTEVAHTDGKGGFTTHSYAATEGISLPAADIDGDGHPDLVLQQIQNSSNFIILLGNGDGTLKANSSVMYRSGHAPVVADVNGDGIADLLYFPGTGDPSEIAICLGRGDGTFYILPQHIQLPRLNLEQQIPDPFVFFPGDFNGDGKTDLAVVAGGNPADVYRNPIRNAQLFIYIGNGDGTFQTPSSAMHLGRKVATSVLAGDFDGDGKNDLAVAYLDQQPDYHNNHIYLHFLHGNGDGTFAQQVLLADLGYSAYAPTILAADLNHDGKLDIVCQTENDAFSFISQGNGVFSHIRSYFSSKRSGTLLALTDVTGDGFPDAISTKGIFAGHGTGGFDAEPYYSFPITNITAATTGDLNGDGRPDIVTLESMDKTLVPTDLHLSGSSPSNYQVSVYFSTSAGGITADTHTYIAGTQGNSFSPVPALAHLNKQAPADSGKLDLLVTFPYSHVAALLNQNNPQPDSH